MSLVRFLEAPPLKPELFVWAFLFFKMSHFIYILFSEKINRYYIGETHDTDGRLLKHNQNYYENSFTKAANDWKIVLKFECENRDESLFLEKFIKRMKSKKFIQKIISNPSILTDILDKK